MNPKNIFTAIVQGVSKAGAITSFVATSVKNKLLLSFAIVALLVLIVSAIALYSQFWMGQKVNSLLESDVRFAELSKSTESAIFQAQVNERDFFLTYRDNFEQALAFAQDAEKQLAVVNSNMEELNALDIDDENKEKARSAVVTIAMFQTGFSSVVEAIKQRGTDDSGLVGEVRSIGDKIEKAARSSGLAMEPVLQMRRFESSYLLEANTQTADRIFDLLRDMRKLAKTASLSSSGRDQLISLVDDYKLKLNQLTIVDDDIKMSINTYRSTIKMVQPDLEDFFITAREDSLAAKQEMEAIAMRTSLVVLAVSIIAVVAGLIAFTTISGGITRQVHHIMGLFGKIGIGDFTARTPISSSDELGTMARSLNSMLDNIMVLIQTREERDAMQSSVIKLLDEVSGVADGDLSKEAEVTEGFTGAIADAFNFMIIQLRQVISRVQESTYKVSSSAFDIQRTAERLAENNESNALQIAGATSAIDEMAVSIQQVSENASQSAQVAEQALETAKQGTRAVSNTIEGMNRIRQRVQETSKRIKRLGESSQQIGDIVQLIGDIADRTSILALNASIQAAMAGEAGRGFAVVAEQVEALAQRSTNAAKQIAGIVTTIQSETTETVVAMEDTTREVVEGSQLANDAGAALAEIEGVSDRLSELIQSISHSSKQQARGSDELSKTMNEISEVTQQTASGTQQAAVSMRNMADLAEVLRESVSSFKLPSGNGRNQVEGQTLQQDA